MDVTMSCRELWLVTSLLLVVARRMDSDGFMGRSCHSTHPAAPGEAIDAEAADARLFGDSPEHCLNQVPADRNYGPHRIW